jgi:hypothetical protein
MRTVEIGSAARALTPISAFNNLFLITGIYWISGAAEDLIRGRLSLGMLAGYALLAPPLWLAWRTMDPIRAVFSKHGFWIYIYAGVLASAIALIGLSILINREDINAFLALSSAIYVPFAFGAALGVRRLKKSVIAPFGLSLATLMDRAGENSPRPKTTSCPRLNPMRGWTLLAAGALIFLSRAIFVDFAVDIAGDNHGKGLGALGNIDQMLTLLGCYVLMRARANFQPKAEGLLSVDRRPATLFLRSFSDDEKLQAFRTSQYALFDFSLEGRLAGHFAASGPFIAVGSPSHETPPAGAARAFLGDDEWQGRVGQWMQSARLIIVVAGTTKWVEWELDQVVKRGFVDKLIVLFPEKAHIAKTTFTWKPPFYVRSSNADARLEGVRTAFRDSPWASDLLGLEDPNRIRSLTFGPGGEVTLVAGASGSRNECHLAVLIAEQVLVRGIEDKAAQGDNLAVAAPRVARAPGLVEGRA